MRYLVFMFFAFASSTGFACDSLDQFVGKWSADDATAVFHNPRSDHSTPITNFQFEISKDNGIYKISSCQGDADGAVWWCRTGGIKAKDSSLFAVNDEFDSGQKIGICSAGALELGIDNHMLKWIGAPGSSVLNWRLLGNGGTLILEFVSQSLKDSKVSTAINANLRRSEH